MRKHQSSQFETLTRANGSAVLSVVLGLAVLVAMTLTMTSQTFETQIKHEKYIVATQSQTQLQKNLDVVFSNPALCTNLLRINGNNFTLNGYMQPGEYSNGISAGRLLISAMEISDITALPGGYNSASFNIKVSTENRVGTPLRSPSSRVVYRQVGNQVDDCRLEYNPTLACEFFGYDWDANTSRCKVCEGMGGTWRTSQGDCAI